MKLFAQIRKVDEEKRLVYGRAADETIDKSNEALNYADSKPHFVKWSEDISKDTDGKSLGNVRAMHGKVAAGKLTEIDFDDTARTIDVCAKVVDDVEWKKVMEGIYTGFSIGGAYGSKLVEKMDGRDVTRYVAIPSEISLVDRPCIPTAKFFQVQKADGSLTDVEFQTQEDDEELGKVADATVEGTPDQVDELTKLMVEKNMPLGAVIALVKGTQFPPTDEEKAEAEAAAAAKAKLEGAGEDEGTPEEKAEAAKKAKDAADAEACKVAQAALTKAQEVLAEAQALAKASGDAGLIAKAEALAKAEPTPMNKDEPAADLQKLVAEAVAPLQKVIDEANAKIKKLEDEPRAPRVSLRAVSKAADTGEDTINQPTEKDLVKDASGAIHPAASLIKQAMQSGGQPLHQFNVHPNNA